MEMVRAREDLPSYEFGRDTAKDLAESADEHQLKKIVDEQSEEAVQVALGEPR